MTEKDFISADTIRDASLKLVDRMYTQDGFVPDVIYASLRGGVYLANVFSEYYKCIRAKTGGRPVYYAAVVARSYQNMMREGEVVIDGWTYDPSHLRNGDKILIADDIFDTGKTVNALVRIIMSKGIPRSDIKVAVYDYKVPEYKHAEPLPIQPDYYCRKHVLKSADEETWIHYLCHEFECLTDDEIEMVYKDSEVREILRRIVK